MDARKNPAHYFGSFEFVNANFICIMRIYHMRIIAASNYEKGIRVRVNFEFLVRVV